jgi:hypothetical protein
MNDDGLIHALRTEEQLARPAFSASLHSRLAAAIDRERRRQRRRRVALPLAACMAIIALFAARAGQKTSDQRPELAAVNAEAPSVKATAGIGVLLQRSDRAAAELRERMDLPRWSLDRALDSRRITRAVFDRLPVGRLTGASPKPDDASQPPAPQPQAPA